MESLPSGFLQEWCLFPGLWRQHWREPDGESARIFRNGPVLAGCFSFGKTMFSKTLRLPRGTFGTVFLRWSFPGTGRASGRGLSLSRRPVPFPGISCVFRKRGFVLQPRVPKTPGRAGCSRGFPQNGGGYFQTDFFRGGLPGLELRRHPPARQKVCSVKPSAFRKTPSFLTAPGRIPWTPGFWGLFRCPGLRRSTGQCVCFSCHGSEGDGQYRKPGKDSEKPVSFLSYSGAVFLCGNRRMRRPGNLREKRIVPGPRRT